MMERVLAEIKAGHDEMMAEMRPWRKEMNAWIEGTEACVAKLEANREP
jgi:hypothetical protein